MCSGVTPRGPSGWDGDRHAARQARELNVAAQQTEAALRAWLAYWSRWRPRPGRTTASRSGNEGSPADAIAVPRTNNWAGLRPRPLLPCERNHPDLLQSSPRLTSGAAEFVAHGPDPVTGLQRVPARRRSWPRRASARMRGGSSTAGRQRRLQHRRRPFPGGRARGGAGRGVQHHERQRVRKHRAGARASSKSREPTSAMAVNESGLGSSADGKGEEGIDRSFDRAAAPVHLGE